MSINSSSHAGFVRTLKWPLTIIVLNFLLVTVVLGNMSQHPGTRWLGLMIFIAALCYSGWSTYKFFTPSLVLGAASGVLLWFIEHVLLTGASMLLMPLVGLTTSEMAWGGFAGVVLTFFMYAPVAAGLAVIGCYIAKVT